MDKKTFAGLTIIEQGMALLTDGKHIAQVKQNNHLLNLYSLNDFFVEVYFSVTTSQVDKIELVNDDSRIDFYIEELKNEKKAAFKLMRLSSFIPDRRHLPASSVYLFHPT